MWGNSISVACVPPTIKAIDVNAQFSIFVMIGGFSKPLEV